MSSKLGEIAQKMKQFIPFVDSQQEFTRAPTPSSVHIYPEFSDLMKGYWFVFYLIASDCKQS